MDTVAMGKGRTRSVKGWRVSPIHRLDEGVVTMRVEPDADCDGCADEPGVDALMDTVATCTEHTSSFSTL